MSNEEQKDHADSVPEDEPEAEVQGSADIEERLAEAEREKDQFKKLAQRAQADLVNYRNRVRTEQETLQARTAERVAMRFIEVADQLEKALSEEATAGVDKQWVSGVEAIYSNLISVLKGEGFERFDAHGEEFDPRRHDALLATPSTEHPANHVMQQLAAGYTRNGEVVRPAQVEISSAVQAETEEQGSES